MTTPTPAEIRDMSIHSNLAVAMAAAFLTADGMPVERTGIPGMPEYSYFRVNLPFGHHLTVAGRELIYRAKRRAAVLAGGKAPADVRARPKLKAAPRAKKSGAK